MVLLYSVPVYHTIHKAALITISAHTTGVLTPFFITPTHFINPARTPADISANVEFLSTQYGIGS